MEPDWGWDPVLPKLYLTLFRLHFPDMFLPQFWKPSVSAYEQWEIFWILEVLSLTLLPPTPHTFKIWQISFVPGRPSFSNGTRFSKHDEAAEDFTLCLLLRSFQEPAAPHGHQQPHWFLILPLGPFAWAKLLWPELAMAPGKTMWAVILSSFRKENLFCLWNFCSFHSFIALHL